MEKSKPFDYSFKLLLLGNQSVGKTCILQRYLDDIFTSTEKATVGRAHTRVSCAAMRVCTYNLYSRGTIL